MASIKVMIHHPDAIFTGIPNPTHKKVDGFLPQLYSFCQGLGFIVLLIIYMRDKKEIVRQCLSMRRGTRGRFLSLSNLKPVLLFFGGNTRTIPVIGDLNPVTTFSLLLKRK